MPPYGAGFSTKHYLPISYNGVLLDHVSFSETAVPVVYRFFHKIALVYRGKWAYHMHSEAFKDKARLQLHRLKTTL